MPSLLIVDDEVDVRAYLKEYFEKQGLQVLTAATGEEGLELLIKQQPTLVLVDLRLGEGLSGLEVIRRAKQAKATSEIVVVTAVNDSNVFEMARGLGAVDYITKPFMIEELERVVSSRLKF